MKLAGPLAALTLAACVPLWDGTNDDPYVYVQNGTSSSSSGGANRKPEDDGVSIRRECMDARGFGGRGCFSCPPTTNDELLLACTSAEFAEFENSERITGYDSNQPRPVLPPRGPALPPYDADGSGGPGPASTPPPPCPVAAKPNPVMIVGATGFPLDALARAMGTSATIFFLEKGSCDGVASMVVGEPKLAGEVVYFERDGTKNRCVLAGEHPADIATSALFASSCAGTSGLAEQLLLPSTVEDFLGPVNTVMFAVPATSKERAISAAAAYKVFGAASGVAPWTEESLIFRRRASSGNQQTVARALGLDADSFRGRDSNGSSNMLSALRGSPKPDATIGISSSEIVDPSRDSAKALAYRHWGQPVAFYPDSSPGSYDKKNVRDGHYFMWLPLHVFARTNVGDPVAAPNLTLDPNGVNTSERNAAVRRLVYVMTSRQEPPVRTVDLLGALKRSGNVPQCAMEVKRSAEGAPLEPYTPAAPCGCAFESISPGMTASACRSCDSSRPCPGDRPLCSFGYCEKR